MRRGCSDEAMEDDGVLAEGTGSRGGSPELEWPAEGCALWLLTTSQGRGELRQGRRLLCHGEDVGLSRAAAMGEGGTGWIRS